jgi:hypothetical protein
VDFGEGEEVEFFEKEEQVGVQEVRESKEGEFKYGETSI